MNTMRKRYQWLEFVINQTGFHTIAEVGAATGNTTLHLMEHCPKLEKIFVVDDFRPIPESPQWNRQDLEQVFKRKLAKFGDRVVLYKGLSWEQANRFQDQSLDLVFIDASHDEESVTKDLQAWIKKVHPGGVFCGHDLHFPGVVSALRNILPMYHVSGVDNVWYVLMHEYEQFTSFNKQPIINSNQ